MKRIFVRSLAVIGLLAGLDSVCAQSFTIDWHATGSGGTASGGGFALSGTVGQPAASARPMTNGNFSLTGGFWSIFAVQTPGTPLLSVERLGTDIRVFWPVSATGFVLDQSLTAAGSWSQVSFPYTTNATEISIIVPAPAGNQFYRLRKP